MRSPGMNSPLTFNMVSEKSDEAESDDMKIDIQSKKLSFQTSEESEK
jgi:hypothetical protein